MSTEINDPLLQLVRDRDDPYYIKCKLPDSSHPSAHNTPYCNDCKKQEHGILLHYTNFVTPCKCCGSPNHGLFKYDPISDASMANGFAQVSCPSVWTTCIGKMIEEDRMSMKYRPCPQKLAETHNFDVSKAQVNLKQCYTHGCGWHMHTAQFNKLTNAVSQICYDARNPQFKRTITHQLNIDEDEELNL
jgi:hypothetical protein